MVPKGERAMRGPSPKPIVVIPSEPDASTPNRSTDQPLSALNILGASLVPPSTHRPWDGQTIPLSGFRII